MISFEHALSKLLFLANRLDVEEVNLEEAYSRVLANEAIASRDQPPFDASSMDGFALKKIDKLPNKKLLVVGKVAAGKSFKGTIKKGEAVRIFTGAPVPSGANSILIQEDAIELNNFITVREKIEKNDFIRKKGCDYKASKVLLKKGKIDFGKTLMSGTFCAIFPCKMHQNKAKMNNIGYLLKIFALRAGLLLE